MGQFRPNSPSYNPIRKEYALCIPNGTIYIYKHSNYNLIYDQTIQYSGHLFKKLACGKINNDSYDDIVCSCDNTTDSVYFFINNNGAFSNNPTRLYTGSGTGIVELSELSSSYGSLYEDLICAVNNQVKIYINNADYSFIYSQTFTLDPNPVYKIKDIQSADMNKDGYKDLIVSAHGGIRVFYNNGTGYIYPTPSLVTTASGDVIAVGELNYDGFPDIVSTIGMVPKYINNGDGSFSSDGYLANLSADVYRACCFVDLHNKGGNSLIVSRYYSEWPELQVWQYYINDDDEMPCPPRNLTVVNYNNHPKLQWIANEEADINHYDVWRRYYLNGTPLNDWECIASVDHPIDNYIDQGTTYLNNKNQCAYYYIRAVDNDGDPSYETSIPSNLVFFNCIVPMGSKEDPVFAQIEEPDFPCMAASPNPFNPDTHIEYCVPEAGLVRLVVYDINGRIAANLVNGVQTEGEYAVQFNGIDLPSGVYFARLIMGGTVQTCKLLLVK